MAGLPAIPTLCELTYDNENGRKTPYRYPCWSGKNSSCTTSDQRNVSFNLPSTECPVSYLEYLRALYELKAVNTPRPSDYHSSRGGRRTVQSTYAYPRHNSYAVSYGYIDRRPKTAFIPHTRPLDLHQQYSLPSLHQSSRGWEQYYENNEEYSDEEPGEKLVWIDALNKWIPEQELHPKNYITFVGNAPVVAKLYASLKEQPGGQEKKRSDSEGKSLPCIRHEAHMDSRKLMNKCGLCGQVHPASLQTKDHKHTQRLVTLQRREELRRQATEIADKKQRKAYSTPLYTPLKDKRSKVRFQRHESANVSRVTSPITATGTDIVPIAKESWESSSDEQIGNGVDDTADGKGESSTESEDKADERWSAEDLGYVVVTLSDIEEATSAMEAFEEEEDEKQRIVKDKARAKDLAWAEQMEKQHKARIDAEERARLAAKAAEEAAEAERQARAAAEKKLIGAGVVDGNVSGNVSHHRQSVRGSTNLSTISSSSTSTKRSTVKKSTTSVSDSNSLHKKMSASLAKSSKSVHRASSTKLSKKSSVKLKTSSSKDQLEKTTTDSSEKLGKPPKLSEAPPQTKLRKAKHIQLSIPNANSDPKQKGTKSAPTKDSKWKKLEKAKLVKPNMDMSLCKAEPIPFLQTEEDMGAESSDSSTSTQTIPTVADTRVGPLSLTVEEEPERPPSSPRSPGRQRRYSIIKKERVGQRKRPQQQQLSTPEELTSVTEVRKTSSWIFDNDEDDEQGDENVENKEDTEDSIGPLLDRPPDLPDPDSFKSCSHSDKSNRRKNSIQTPIIQKLDKKLKRRPGIKDTSYEEDLRRQELAEKRRQKHMEMIEKMKSKKLNLGWDGQDGADGPNFEDYGFLAKYCIFNKSNIEMYRHTFDIVDEDKRGWLPASDVLVALRAVNNRLSDSEENYLLRLLEMIGYNFVKGADFKLFSVMSALSQKISSLDNWMKNMIGQMDFKMLEMKMFMCKKLWECNVDPETNKITIDQLCVELRAGGVSYQHETEVRQKLDHIEDLDLLDFLTYIPLFIMIHQSVVDNPLDDVRDK